ncbi:hypothetical protein EHP00_525 [Ecytonucleospora hepatopenaei]|uniref:Uncharacterized protein n=1 Tax=Ecytonucleospora hepatopenaei TaxID=646526 RepID=A0A1W0E436_9MICR|nr:hypothetical protein EHP00_525 [Ecytonucleospora hepatopenaei]
MYIKLILHWIATFYFINCKEHHHRKKSNKLKGMHKHYRIHLATPLDTKYLNTKENTENDIKQDNLLPNKKEDKNALPNEKLAEDTSKLPQDNVKEESNKDLTEESNEDLTEENDDKENNENKDEKIKQEKDCEESDFNNKENIGFKEKQPTKLINKIINGRQENLSNKNDDNAGEIEKDINSSERDTDKNEEINLSKNKTQKTLINKKSNLAPEINSQDIKEELVKRIKCKNSNKFKMPKELKRVFEKYTPQQYNDQYKKYIEERGKKNTDALLNALTQKVKKLDIKCHTKPDITSIDEIKRQICGEKKVNDQKQSVKDLPPSYYRTSIEKGNYIK